MLLFQIENPAFALLSVRIIDLNPVFAIKLNADVDALEWFGRKLNTEQLHRCNEILITLFS
jgi:hypothetical protein